MQISFDWLMLLWVLSLVAILLLLMSLIFFWIKNKFRFSGVNKTQLGFFTCVFLFWSSIDVWLYTYVAQAISYVNSEGYKVQEKCIENGVCPKELDGWTKYSYIDEDTRYKTTYVDIISARILYIPHNEHTEFGVSLAYGVGEGWMATGGSKVDFMPIPAHTSSNNFIVGKVTRLLERAWSRF